MRKDITLIIGLLMLALVLYGLFAATAKFAKPKLSVDLSHSSVVKQMQSLNRLETAQFTIEKIIDAGYQGNFFQNILYGDRILLIAHAEVVAGFDLSKISGDDIKIKYADGHQLTIELPAPEIFFSILDNSKTKVYDRRTGFLAAYDKDLESEARAQAEATIKADACAGEILEVAAKNAEEQLENMFLSLGFTEVRIVTPKGSCD